MYVIYVEYALLSIALLEQSMGIELCKTRGLIRHVENAINMIKKLKRGRLSDYYEC